MYTYIYLHDSVTLSDGIWLCTARFTRHSSKAYELAMYHGIANTDTNAHLLTTVTDRLFPNNEWIISGVIDISMPTPVACFVRFGDYNIALDTYKYSLVALKLA